MKPVKSELIECPVCGREYLPAEIYLPKYFFGHPHNIVRDVYGHILDVEGPQMDLHETFVCEKCNTPFYVHAKVCFVTDSVEEENMDELYSTEIQKNTLFTQDDQD